MDRGFRRNFLALAVLLAVFFLLGEPTSQAHAKESRCAGAPMVLTPEHFEKPICLFVRSRQCPQSAQSTEPACNFLYDYYDEDGLYHPVSEESIFRLMPKQVPVLIIVHGSFMSLEEDPKLYEAYQWIQAGAPDQPLVVFCYRWPSAVGCKALLGSVAVCELAQRAEFNGFYLAQLINDIPDQNPVRLLGHSHGCRMIASALHLLSGGRVDGKTLKPSSFSNRSMRVTFFSAAMDHDWFNPGQCYDLAFHRMCWMQNHKHTCDWALLTYPFRYPGSSRALGQIGFTRKDRQKLGDQAEKIQQCDDGKGQGLLKYGHGLKSYLRDPATKTAVLSNIYSP